MKDAWERAHELIEKNDVPPLPEDVERHVDTLIAGYLASPRVTRPRHAVVAGTRRPRRRSA